MADAIDWRPATAADADEVAALVHGAYRGAGGWTNEIGLVEGRRIDAAAVAQIVARPESLIVVVPGGDGRRLVGCCLVDSGEDGVAHLGLFAVEPARQGHGRGRALVALARRLAVERFDAHMLEISVVSGQEPLLAWYRRLGFRPTGRTRPFGADPRDRPLVDGLHFVIMRMPLAREPYALSWSAGKDSALALQSLRAAAGPEPIALITTVTEGFDRISMHGVRRTLLRAQAAAVGAALVEVTIPPACRNEVYEQRMRDALSAPPLDAAREIAFGDLFLADIRAYRVQRCAAAGRAARFPLWDDDTAALAHRFVADGFRAYVVCVDPAQLDPSFAGRPFDEALLADLPQSVDPCGENGEFHTFVVDGPIFAAPLVVAPGEVVVRDGFVFADLQPA